MVETDFDDVHIGGCNIPDTSAVLRVPVWKIGAGNISIRSSYKFSRCTSRDYASEVDLSIVCPKSAVPGTITVRDKHHLQNLTKRIICYAAVATFSSN